MSSYRKVSNEIVREIRERYAANRTMKELADEYGLHHLTARRIIKRIGAYSDVADKEIEEKPVDTI